MLVKFGVGCAVLLSLAIGMCAMGGCALLTRSVLYYPDATRVDPADVGLPEMREEVLTAADGTQLVVWRSDGPEDAGAEDMHSRVVYFHGNASNLAKRAAFFRYFLDEGFGLVALSYRSFGGSKGQPSEAHNISDAVMVLDWLYADGWSGATTALYGESLGSGVAVQVAAQRDVAGVVVHAPYAAIDDLMAEKAPWALPKLLTTDRYRSVEFVAGIDAPLLWLHGEADRVIPMHHGQRLFDAAREPKAGVIIPGAGHNDLYGASLFSTHTAPFLRRVTRELGGESSL